MYLIPFKLFLHALLAMCKSLLSCLLPTADLCMTILKMRFPCICNFSFLEYFLSTVVFIAKALLLPRTEP